MIRGTTAVYGIFGDPVAHSLSPPMQNRAFAAAGIDAIYVPYHVRPEGLPAAVAGMRSLGIRGVNVTVPHKEAILPLLDEVDPCAQRIGAVNTVINRDGRLAGFNTDGIGLVRALKEDLAVDPAGVTVALLGAGGAARAAASALAEAGVRHLIIINRTLARARKLAEDFAPHFSGTTFECLAWTEEALAAATARADLLVNSVSVGLYEGENELLPWPLVPPSLRIFDMLYSPAMTALVRAARRQGRYAVDGIGMLAGQGEEAFRLWTGNMPPSGLMRAVLDGFRTPKG